MSTDSTLWLTSYFDGDVEEASLQVAGGELSVMQLKERLLSDHLFCYPRGTQAGDLLVGKESVGRFIQLSDAENVTVKKTPQLSIRVKGLGSVFVPEADRALAKKAADEGWDPLELPPLHCLLPHAEKAVVSRFNATSDTWIDRGIMLAAARNPCASRPQWTLARAADLANAAAPLLLRSPVEGKGYGPTEMRESARASAIARLHAAAFNDHLASKSAEPAAATAAAALDSFLSPRHRPPPAQHLPRIHVQPAAFLELPDRRRGNVGVLVRDLTASAALASAGSTMGSGASPGSDVLNSVRARHREHRVGSGIGGAVHEGPSGGGGALDSSSSGTPGAARWFDDKDDLLDVSDDDDDDGGAGLDSGLNDDGANAPYEDELAGELAAILLDDEGDGDNNGTKDSSDPEQEQVFREAVALRSDPAALLVAFGHFSYAQSWGKLAVVDAVPLKSVDPGSQSVRGVRAAQSFEEPVIAYADQSKSSDSVGSRLSRTAKKPPKDRGAERLQAFVDGHQCNALCRVLNLMPIGPEELSGVDSEIKKMADASSSSGVDAPSSASRPAVSPLLADVCEKALNQDKPKHYELAKTNPPAKLAWVASLTGHRGHVNAVVVGTHCVFTASSDKTVRVWNARTFAHMQTLEGHRSDVCSLALGAQGRNTSPQTELFSGSEDKTM